jgi:site-specific recombinase XerC
MSNDIFFGGNAFSIQPKVKRKTSPPVKPVPEVVSQQTILNIIRDDKLRLETKALISLIYISGGRIGEVLKVRPMDLHKIDDSLIRVSLITEKNKRTPQREVPVFLNPIEKEMVGYILQYIDAKQSIHELKDSEPIFHKSQPTIRKRLKRILVTVRANDMANKSIIEDYSLGTHPHYFRHCRATHFTIQYRLNAFELTNVMGWSDTRMAERYVHLDWKNVAETMKREGDVRVDFR